FPHVADHYRKNSCAGRRNSFIHIVYLGRGSSCRVSAEIYSIASISVIGTIVVAERDSTYFVYFYALGSTEPGYHDCCVIVGGKHSCAIASSTNGNLISSDIPQCAGKIDSIAVVHARDRRI